MTMNIGENVLQILQEAGPQGLHVGKISLHVFNGMNSLFEERDFEEVHHDVNMFLIEAERLKKEEEKRPLVIRLRRGVYKINKRAMNDIELQFKFKEPSMEEHSTEDMVRERRQGKEEDDIFLPFF